MKRAWITMVILGTSLLAAPVPARGDAGDRCEYPAGRRLSMGRDETGYFVRATPTDPRGRGQGGPLILAVGDALALEGHATILYLATATVRDIGGGEWHGPDPLSVLKAFAQAVGLFVATPAPNWWVIGRPCDFDPPATITVAVQCLGPSGQGWSDPAAVNGLEDALVTQLPVRVIQRVDYEGEALLTVQYYWLPEEGPDMLLVLASQPGGAHLGPVYQGFKVRVGREGSKVKVNCIWAMNQNCVPSGRFVPEIAEDFDGDGYRDFVFDAGGDEHYANTIVSGKDGRLLLAFGLDNEIAVERKPTGLPRFAVEGTYDPQYGGEVGRDEEPEHERPVVLLFDRATKRFQPAHGSESTVTEQSIAKAPGGQFNRPRRALAAALGGTEKVRAYLLMPGCSYPVGGYEEIRAVERAYPERILFKYSPPASTE